MAKRPIIIDDLFKIKLVGDPQISPDGKTIAFVLTTTDFEKDKYDSHIWLVPSDGRKSATQFTFGAGRDRAPRWSPDGERIAFISNRDDEKKEQLYLISLAGGEALRLTQDATPALQRTQGGASDKPSPALWSPDGAMIAYTAKVVTKESKSANGKREGSDVLAYTRLNYKFDGEGSWDYGWRQVFTLTLTLSRSAGEGKQLTRGNFNHGSPCWSPDSKTLVFSANRSANADETNISDLWSVPARGGALKRLTRRKGPTQAPTISPDGKWIAFVGHENEHMRATKSDVYVMPARGGQATKIAPGFDPDYGNSVLGDLRASAHESASPVWSRDGRSVYFIATDHGSTQIFAADARGGGVIAITTGAHQVYDFSYAADRFALTISDVLNPNDLFVCDPRGKTKQLTRVNAELTNAWQLSRPERFEVQHEGRTVEGWMMKPVGWKASRKYPGLLDIHGGPQNAFGYAFFHEMQVLAAAGYAVIFTNPRGSTGCGDEFTRAVCKDWGGGDYRDLMAAMDFVLKKYSWVNPRRLGVFGGSYGGYMTSWVVTHTNRFKAAISERALNNWHSFSGTSDIGAYFGPDSQIGFDIWENPDEHLAHSPISHVANCKTPTLILHSEKDFRCPIEQAEQLYIALKKLHVPTEFVRFPDESHNLSRNGKPKHRKERLERMVAWWKKYI
jgi:dipeptidyl aminopeptidase/acylaminoacyl peptidase